MVTPPGEGGLGAIRISGPKTSDIVSKIFYSADNKLKLHKHFHLYYGHIIDKNRSIVDEVTLVEMPHGKSFTGQDQAEIFCHGGQYVLKAILDLILTFDIRAAEPGEFTQRAFLAGRIDLARAEAVADLIAAQTKYSYENAKKQLLGRYSEYLDELRSRAIKILAEVEASVDYPEEDIETEASPVVDELNQLIEEITDLLGSYDSGKIIKDGFSIAIAGRPNAGKSSLFNLLLNQNRAIVSATAGTTRDYLTEWIDLDGIAVSLTDTAGLRTDSRVGIVEKAGQDSAVNILKEADLIIWIFDIYRKNWKAELEEDCDKYSEYGEMIIIANKTDKLKDGTDINGSEFIPLSCLTKKGYKGLKTKLVSRIKDNMPDLTDRLVVTSARHQSKLKKSLKALKLARKSVKTGESPEIIAFELKNGLNEIDEITGRIYNEDILADIFSRFCVGK